MTILLVEQKRQLRVGRLRRIRARDRPRRAEGESDKLRTDPRSRAYWEPELHVTDPRADGVKGLYLLFAWLLSARDRGWVTERKGYGERVGLAFGLLLTVVGLLCVLLSGRPLTLEDRGHFRGATPLRDSVLGARSVEGAAIWRRILRHSSAVSARARQRAGRA